MIDTNALRGIIVSRGVSGKDVAAVLDMTPKTFYLRMRRGIFNSDEMYKMVEYLKISNPAEIFFEFDVLFQYLFVYDPTNFSEEPIKCLPDPFPKDPWSAFFICTQCEKRRPGAFFVIILGQPLSFGKVYDIKHYEISMKEA